MPLERYAASEAALDLFVKLIRAARSVLHRTESTMAAGGLTTTQFAVMEALLHKGPLGHGELKSKVLTSPGNLTDVIDKLEARGLLTRQREAGDGRRVCIALTTVGRILIERVFPPHAAHITRVMAVLEPAEQAELARLLRKLGLEAGTVAPR